jgi:S1-C subfamily serine protease
VNPNPKENPMNRTFRTLAAAAVVVTAASAFAGDGKPCTASKEECQRHFTALKTQGWSGIEAEKVEKGLVVKKVAAGRPAEAAGLRAGDVLLGFNGVAYKEGNWERIQALRADTHAGEQGVYTVKRGRQLKNFEVRFAAIPDGVYTAMVNEHMSAEHGDVARN